MTFTYKVERLDGTPAESSSCEKTLLLWSPGNTIPSARTRRCRSAGLGDDDADQAPALVVEELA
jgi:hypothetical protein